MTAEATQDFCGIATPAPEPRMFARSISEGYAEATLNRGLIGREDRDIVDLNLKNLHPGEPWRNR